MMRRRGPGLIRTAARTAVIAGTATAVSGRVAHRQQQRYAEEAQQPSGAYYAPEGQAYVETEPDYVQELERLNQLKNQGVNVSACIRQGDPSNEIVGYALKIKADLVVLGHTDKGMITRWFQGSIGSKLLSHLPCSLLIATEH